MNRWESFLNFIKRRKKLTIVLSVIFIMLITVVILIFTLFSLKNVSLNFKTETQYIDDDMQGKIIKETHNEGISTVLFADKSRLIKRLEKEFPYIKIINIETVMPSSFVIHCIEREELYAIESEGKIFYLDEDLKVLRVSEEDFVSTETSAVLLNISDLELHLNTLEAGQFLRFNEVEEEGLVGILAGNVQSTLTSLLVAFEENNRNIAIFRANYSEIRIDFDFRPNTFASDMIWYVCLSLIDNNGFQTVIVESNKNLSQKIAIMIDVINNISTTEPERLLSERLVISENIKGEFIYFLEEIG